MLALENKQRKTHELWLVETTLLNIFQSLKADLPRAS